MWATLWLTCALFVGTCYSQWLNGPLTNACTDMQTGLFGAPQTSVSPYTLSVSTDIYVPNFGIQVTLSGPDFLGFFIQVRRSDNDFGSADLGLGSFSNAPLNTRLLSCEGGNNNGWSHSSYVAKTSETIQWMAPPLTNEGPIRFRATVVQNANTFWTEIYSVNITSSPLIRCPDEFFTSSGSSLLVPSPAVAGFNGDVTFTYSVNGATIPAVTNLPYHTLSTANVAFNIIPITVTASDGTSNQQCTFVASVFNTGALTITCPPDQIAPATSGVSANMNLPRAEVRDPFGTQLPVTYLTSPKVNLSPTSPTTMDELTGSFNRGLTYVLAYATFNTQTVACNYIVQVVDLTPDLTCPSWPTTIDSQSTRTPVEQTTLIWDNPTPLSFPNLNVVAVSYTYNGQPLGVTTLPNGLQRQASFSGATVPTLVVTATATAVESGTLLSASCSFAVNVPTIECPTLTYASRTGEVYVPESTVSNFNGPVTIMYSQNSGNQIDFANPQDPFHTLQNVDGGIQQFLTVTATDAFGNSAQCLLGVYALVPAVIPLPTLICPAQDQMFLAAGSPSTLIVNGANLFTSNNAISVQYLSSPTVALTQIGTTQIQGNFNYGTTYIYAFATQGGLSVSCVFSVTVPEPTIDCPTLTYASRTGEVFVPASTVSNFNGPVTISYSQTSGNPITVVNSQDPFQTLQNVDGGIPQFLTVTATDTSGNLAQCMLGVYAFLPFSIPLPTLSCGNQVFQATTSNMVVIGATANPSSTPVAYLTSPDVANLNPPIRTPVLSSTISGNFNAGTTFIYAYATQGQYSVSCIFNVMVNAVTPTLTCPSTTGTPGTVVSTSTQVSWSQPIPVNFPQGSVQLSYFANGQQLFPSSTNGQPMYTFALGQGTPVQARATDGINTAICDFTVYVLNVICPDGGTIMSNNYIWDNPTAQGFPTTPTITYAIAGAQIFPTQVGPTQVQYTSFQPGSSTDIVVTASDGQGGAVSCLFTVVYTQSVAGEVVCPQQIVSSSNQVSWTVPTTNNFVGQPIISYSINSNNISPTILNNVATYTFTQGTMNTVVVMARDDVNNQVALCAFSVNILQINCPADIVELFTLISWAAPTTDGFQTAPSISYLIAGNVITPASQNGLLTYPFSAGTSTPVMALATDPGNSGNAVACTFLVHVPNINCPNRIIQSSSTTVSWENAIASGFPQTPVITYSIGGQTISTVDANGRPTSVFPSGVTEVTATAVDTMGTTLACTYKVNVATTPPSITCPADLRFDSTVARSVSFPAVNAFDIDQGRILGVAYTYSRPVTGETQTSNTITATFPTGTTTVSVKSDADANNERAICDFTVTVTGLICPVGPITSLTPSVTWNSPSTVGFPNSLDVTFRYINLNTNTDISPTTNTDGSLQYGSFPTGSTNVRVIAEDSIGNAAACQFTVEVTPIAPTVTCPLSQFISSTTPAPVVFNPPISARDSSNQPIPVNILSDQPVTNMNDFGGTFGLGVTSVIVNTVRDANGLQADCSFTITVLGLTCPDPVDSNTATAEWINPIPQGFNGGLGSITYSFNGGGFNPTPLANGRQRYDNFPVGMTTLVRATATHSSGNLATCVFPVTVAQPTAPTITCPDNQVSTVTSQSTTSQVFFAPATAMDSSGNNVAIRSYVASPLTILQTTNVPFSGNFSPGRTFITVTTEQDANGLSNQCTFTISVLAMTCPVLTSFQSSTVVWDTPVPVGFPDVNNVVITYSDANGNPLFPAPTLLPSGQYQFTFAPGTTQTIRATALDSLGNSVDCDFLVITPPAEITCPSGPFTVMSNELQVAGPTVAGYGNNALVTYTGNGRQLGAFLASTPIITLIGLDLGVNLVRAEVNDGNGASDFCVFTVTVERPQYGPWEQWSACILIITTCQQTRQRFCNDPNPFDSINCDGLAFEQRECPFGSCGVASWDNWSVWSECSLTCSTGASVGSRSRTRTCTDPISGDGDTCIGDSLEVEQCNTNPCVVWTQWSPWSACSVPCNGGVRNRERRCVDETGQDQPIALCGGLGDMIEQCNLHICPPDPVWLLWSQWTDCSERCGGGIQERSRMCSDPVPLDAILCVGQPDPSGIQQDVRPCNIDICPEPQWSLWGIWSDCSATCNRGFRWRTRDCIDPFPTDNDICVGFNTETEVCNDILCPVATWQTWGEWGGCSATCGTAVQTRYRDCDDPNPNDLDTCEGSASTSESCYSQPCPFPVWQQWGFWSTCTSTCGGGTRERRRICEDSDADASTNCSGPDFDTVTCNTLQCIEATWTNWNSWGICSETCGSGIRTRQRTCQDQLGQTCPGTAADSQSCFIQQCIEPVWLQWGQWAACSATCGADGIRQRFRICSHPDQNQCTIPGVSEPEQNERCNDFPCVEPFWTLWSAWSLCSTTCGGGQQTRTRICRDPNTLDDKECGGDAIESRDCNQFGCPQSQWTGWNDWSVCSVPCNGGVRARDRECYNTGLLAPPCPGGEGQVETCNLDRCPAYWDVWGTWGPCSTTCGNGQQRRERSCIDPIAADGFTCVADMDGFDSFQTRQCNREPCVGWNTWLSWSSCTVSCGSGTRQRFRTCYKPNPFDPDCEGGNTDVHPDPCSTNKCPQWNDWNTYGACSVTCGGGTRQRVRTCYDADRTDTATCVGESVGIDPVPCNIDACEGPVAAWSGWSAWTGCSQTCGLGLQQRVRTCYDPDRTDSVTCSNGDRTDSRVCSGAECVSPEWNEWQPWTCSVTCGGGNRARFRTCIDPDPSDTQTCLGQNIEQDPFQCNTQACPVPFWSAWNSWLSCSVSCGGGARERRRDCNVPDGLPQGSYCTGIDREPDAQPCSSQNCPVVIPPIWNQWGAWDTCSVTCGGGFRERIRNCRDPDPSDFVLCTGAGSERDPVLCSSQACPPPPSWNQWGAWGQCSQECGGGDRSRVRTCEDAVPNDGFFCNTGSSIESQECNTMVCAAWSPWNSWNACSTDCGGGITRRERTCNAIADSSSACSGDNFETTDCNPDECPTSGPNIALIIGLTAAGFLLAAIIGAILCLVCCRRAPQATVVYKEEPLPLPPVYPPTPSPPRSPPRQRRDEVELIEKPKPEIRWVARRVPGVRAVVREEPSVRFARTVRPAFLVDGNSGPGGRYVLSAGDRPMYSDGGYGDQGMIRGINNSYYR